MLWTAFIFGLLGSFHCVGMCGPIAFMLPIDRSSRTKGFLQLMSYHTGRLSTYTLLGLIFGSLGRQFHLFGFQQQLSLLIGLLMIVAVVLPVFFQRVFPFKTFGYSLVGRLKKILGLQLKRKGRGIFFALGLTNGLLPCGLVYLALFGSLAAGDAAQGAVYMLLFGIGTVPLMSLVVYSRNVLGVRSRAFFTRLIPYVIVLMGLLFMLRGMGLGIPYVSPDPSVSQPQVISRHSCH